MIGKNHTTVYYREMQETEKKLNERTKILAVIGQTASGKSDLAVVLAKKFNGEVVSADSRQVYRRMNIGTGKITKKEMRSVPHYLLDVIDPQSTFTVARYKKHAEKAIHGILRRGKLPILCGGTGYYVQTITGGTNIPSVKPNTALRKRLEYAGTPELFAILKRLDPRRAGEIDQHNRRRLVRAIEIVNYLGVVPLIENTPRYDVLSIGIKTNDQILKEKIATRLHARIRHGMIAEAKRLHDDGVSWKRMEEIGLEYKHLALHLQGKLSREEMERQLTAAIWQYAKRQKTWFKRDKTIHWINAKEIKEVEQLVKGFLK